MFCCRSSLLTFFKFDFFLNCFRYTIRVSNGLEPDRMSRLSADDISRSLQEKELKQKNRHREENTKCL